MVAYEAMRGAFAAAGALVRIDGPGLLADLDAEMSRGPLNAQHFRIGQLLDVSMLAAVDHARREGAHGAVVRRKGFVELGHDAADGRASLHEIDFEARIGKVQ